MSKGFQARALPTVNIGGSQFFLDLRLQEFREVGAWWNIIRIKDVAEMDDGSLIMYFDPITKNQFEGKQADLDLRPDVFIVELPSLDKLDPVGYQMFLEQWELDHPMEVAMMQALVKVVDEKEEKTQTRENEIKTIGEVLQKQKPLLEKKRNRGRGGPKR